MNAQQPPRIALIAAKHPGVLHVTWQDGSRTRHDLASLIHDRLWAAPLRDPVVFASAQAQDDGWQVVWPGTDVALSAAGLWEDVHPRLGAAATMTPAEFSAWLGELGLSFAQAADALGISKRMLKYYAAGTYVIPKTVWLACMHLAAEHARQAAGIAGPSGQPGRDGWQRHRIA